MATRLLESALHGACPATGRACQSAPEDPSNSSLWRRSRRGPHCSNSNCAASGAQRPGAHTTPEHSPASHISSTVFAVASASANHWQCKGCASGTHRQVLFSQLWTTHHSARNSSMFIKKRRTTRTARHHKDGGLHLHLGGTEMHVSATTTLAMKMHCASIVTGVDNTAGADGHRCVDAGFFGVWTTADPETNQRCLFAFPPSHCQQERERQRQQFQIIAVFSGEKNGGLSLLAPVRWCRSCVLAGRTDAWSRRLVTQSDGPDEHWEGVEQAE